MRVYVDISDDVLDDFVRTGFTIRDQRTDPLLLRQLVGFLVAENSRDLPTAMRFSAYLAQCREAQAREWQAKNAQRDYYGSISKGEAA